jgi:hypothetical protein
MIRIHNTEIDEIIDREMTIDEAADYALQLDAVKTRNDEQLAKETQKAALLVRLGITAEEAALLLS